MTTRLDHLAAAVPHTSPFLVRLPIPEWLSPRNFT
jgi:hypothetical protein